MPLTKKELNLSKKIRSSNAELINIAFNKLLVEIKQNPQINLLDLQANRLENRHIPMLLEALKQHKSLIEIDISFNFLHELGPDLAFFLSILVMNNPNLEKIYLRGCRIDDVEFYKIISALSSNSSHTLSKVYLDFSRNNLTSISADLAIAKKVHPSTLDRLMFNNTITSGNENMIDIIQEILEGNIEKKSPTLTAYYDLHSSQNHNASNNIELDFNSLKLVK